MEILHTRGVVLSSQTCGESDIQCVILTRDSGKCRVIFKGLRKSKKRSLSASEPGSLIDFTYYHHPEKNSHIAGDFTSVDFTEAIRSDYYRICVFMFLLEITDRTTAWDDPSAALFDLVVSARQTLMTTDYPLHLAAVYCVHCLRIHGLQPDFSRCRVCGSPLVTSFSLHPADLQPVCISCSRAVSGLLSVHARDFLLNSLRMKFRLIDCTLYHEDEILDFLYYTILYVENHYSVQIRSGRFILDKKK